MDIQFLNHGSVFLIYPVTDEGKAWMDENLPEDAPMLGDSVVCEPRYVADIANGAYNDGLDVG